MLEVLKSFLHCSASVDYLFKTCFLSFAGADVRLFLHGSLLRKLPHDSRCCLSEIQEQPGKVQNLIDDQ